MGEPNRSGFSLLELLIASRGPSQRVLSAAQIRHDRGMSLIEVMLVAAIGMVITAMALPSLMNLQRAYRVHSDSGALQAYMSGARVRAASQYRPYSLNVDPAAGTYIMEQLTQTSYNPFGTPSSVTYSSQSPAVYESGTQYFDHGNTVYNCRPSGITAFPSPVTADPGTCTGAFYFYFNTRGLPVDNTGSALASGGVAIYIQGQSGLLDAVTVSSGGAIQSWNYSPSSSTWQIR
jgi:Tfp pilus assembly protein FimT